MHPANEIQAQHLKRLLDVIFAELEKEHKITIDAKEKLTNELAHQLLPTLKSPAVKNPALFLKSLKVFCLTHALKNNPKLMLNATLRNQLNELEFELKLVLEGKALRVDDKKIHLLIMRLLPVLEMMAKEDPALKQLVVAMKSLQEMVLVSDEAQKTISSEKSNDMSDDPLFKMFIKLYRMTPMGVLVPGTDDENEANVILQSAAMGGDPTDNSVIREAELDNEGIPLEAKQEEHRSAMSFPPKPLPPGGEVH